ncbi:MAG: M20/M25/M40 family metallo-hydrolase [Chloroflexota bacterium]|nr:M20/M25/M40 family metallo-hydrolase [Chloroflexota bacterium]
MTDYRSNDDLARSIGDAAIEYLAALVRLDTTSPPGNERQATDYIVAVLATEGIEATVVESEPTRANLVARLKAENPTGRPVMLMGHTDVVAVERDKWEHDPFGSEIIDGFMWGRGTLDMKNQVAGQLAAFLALKRAGLPLTRDVIYAAFADEEVSGTLGAGWMYEHHRDLIDAEFALNEGGGSQVELGGARFYTCGTGEKGQSILNVTFRGNPGHASTPIPDTAMEKLGIALERLRAWEPDLTITEPVRAMLEGIGDVLGGNAQAEIRRILALESPVWDDFADLPLSDRDRTRLYAITHHTAVPTMLTAGQRINVIPSEVTLGIDCRLVPGTTPEEWRQLVSDVIGGVGEVELVNRNAGIASDPHSAFFDAINGTLTGLVPDAHLVPNLIGGRTDAAWFPDIKVYGFYPMLPVDRDGAYEGTVHGHNERIHLDDIRFGARFAYDLIAGFATS